MAPSWSTADSRILLFARASPRPMLMTILSRRGTWFGFFIPNSFISEGTPSLRYRIFRRAGLVSSPSSMLAEKPAFLTSSLPFRFAFFSAFALSAFSSAIALPRLASTGRQDSSAVDRGRSCTQSMFASHFLQKRTFLSPLARIPTRVGASHFLQTTWTAPSAMLPGRSRMPPSGLARSRPLRMCRFTVRSPSTRTRSASRSMARIFPRLLALSLLDRSAPATTSTRSPTFSFCMALSRSALPALEHFRGEGDDLHELPGAELAGHGAEDAGPDGLEVLVDQHRRVPVELDEAAVRPPHLALGPDDDRLGHVALLHLAVG